MTEDDRQKGTERTKDSTKDESEEAKSTRQDREKGDTQESNQDGEGAIGGVEDDDLEGLGEAKWG
jgi:hypothetical protein